MRDYFTFGAVFQLLLSLLLLWPGYTGRGSTDSRTAAGIEHAEVTAIAVHPSDSNTVYVGTYGDGLLKSTNGGSAWTKVRLGQIMPGTPTTPAGDIAIEAIAICPYNGGIVCVGSDDGIYKSTDGGTWVAKRIPSVGVVGELVIAPSNANIIYAAGIDRGVFKSTDGGDNWLTVGPDAARARSLAVDPSQPGTVYLAGAKAGLFKTTDGGANWVNLNSRIPKSNRWRELNIQAVAIDPSNTGVVYAGNYGSGMFKSQDGGLTWIEPSDGPDGAEMVTAVVIDPSHVSIIYFSTASGGVYKSVDGGAKWVTVNNGLTDKLVRAMAIDPSDANTLYLGTFRGGVFKSTDGGGKWVAINAGLPQRGAYKKIGGDN